MDVSPPVVFDALEELRGEIEEVAADPTLTVEQRNGRLVEFRADLMDMLGAIDSYLGDNLVEQAGEQDDPMAVARLHENAAIRERLIESGELTEDAADSIMLYSREQLVELAEEGLLEETAAHVTRFMAGLGRFDPAKHPRGRGGKFSEVLGKVTKLKDGDTHRVGNDVRVIRAGDNYRVQHGGMVIGRTKNAVEAATIATTRFEMPKPPRREFKGAVRPGIRPGDRVEVTGGEHRGKVGTLKSHGPEDSHVLTDSGEHLHVPQDSLRQHSDRAPSETAAAKDWIRQGGGKEPTPAEAKAAKAELEAKAGEKGLSPEEKAKLYQQRREALEQRAVSAIASAAARGKLSDAEAHFNDAGKVSQRTLATYVEQAGTTPQTIDLYSKLDPASGKRVWDESRRQLHERIITAYLKERKTDPATGKPVLDYSPEAKDLQAHPDGPRAMFSGGGYAAGKGSVLKILAARGDAPPDAFVLDPDQLKAELPEFQSLIGTDPEANMVNYREAWAIAQEIQARAMERKLNIIVDGISDTSPEEMGQRARAFTSRGYQAHAVYVDIPTEEAMRRAANRAVNAKDDSDRRMIPAVIMRAVHRDVAATVPALPGYLHDHEIPLKLEVWDNNAGKDAEGQFLPPRPFFSYDSVGGRQVLDQALWDAFQAKAHETIPNVDAPSAG